MKLGHYLAHRHPYPTRCVLESEQTVRGQGKQGRKEGAKIK